jgi:hypothetical protein
MSHSSREIALTFVRTSPDRMRNYIQIGDDRITLEQKETLREAKAQWADALWIVEQIMLRGAEEEHLKGSK